MMSDKIIYILSVIVVLLLLLRLKPKYKTKHKRNIQTADRVLLKLKSFQGENIEGRQIAYLRKIDPFVFEELLLNAYKNKGIKIIRNKRYTGDGGIDGKILLDNKLILIQAKRYSSYIVKSHLLEFAQVINLQKANGGYFIHTGKTSDTNFSIAKTLNIKIISGSKLLNLIFNR